MVPTACFKARFSSVGDPNNGPHWATSIDINVSKSNACLSLGTCPPDSQSLATCLCDPSTSARQVVEIISHSINHVHVFLERIGSSTRRQVRPSLQNGSQHVGWSLARVRSWDTKDLVRRYRILGREISIDVGRKMWLVEGRRTRHDDGRTEVHRSDASRLENVQWIHLQDI